MYYNINKLIETLKKHADYLQTGDASKRADLSGADLSGADLSGAILPKEPDHEETSNG